MTISNSTISGNSAPAGGGIFQTNGTLSVRNSTLGDNSGATDAGGIWGFGGTRTFRNTIIAGNTAPNSPDVAGSLGSQGHNLIGNGTGGSGYDPTDLVGTSSHPIDPMLGPLQDNGGPTATMAPLVGSPGVAAGDIADAPPTDQRGAPRLGVDDEFGLHEVIRGSILRGPVSLLQAAVQSAGAGRGGRSVLRGRPACVLQAVEETLIRRPIKQNKVNTVGGLLRLIPRCLLLWCSTMALAV
jgi:hypothetical protein